MFCKRAIDRHPIAKIPFDKVSFARHGRTMSLVKTVEDNDFLARLAELLRCNAPNITRPSCNENLHVCASCFASR